MARRNRRGPAGQPILHSDRPPARSTPPASGKIAVKVINHYGDEVLKVFEVANSSARPETLPGTNAAFLRTTHCSAFLPLTPAPFRPTIWRSRRLSMSSRIEVNPPSEHSLYLRLFVTTSGGL